MNRSRRTTVALVIAMLAPALARAQKPAPTAIEVWKDANCGCCAEWVRHLEAQGFTVKVNDRGNNAARAKLGMPASLGSCHTALVAGYVIEGHVPAEDIRRLIAEKPVALGLAVPGMPIGSPGMEMGDRRDPYDVLLVAKTGGTRVWRAVR